MKIVNVEDFFHPNAGYQINIVSKYLVKFGHDVTIITSKLNKVSKGLSDFFGVDGIEEYDREYENLTGVKVIRISVMGFVSGRAVFTNELRKIVEYLQPDVLYVHGNDTLSGIRFISKLGKLDFALVSDSHMLEMASANKFNKVFRYFYKTFITPKIIRYSMPVIRTQDDSYVEKYLGIPLEQSPWISYGSDILLFHPDREVRNLFRKSNNIGKDDFVILYAGKLDEAKNGLLLAEAIQKRFNTQKNVVVLVVGNTIGEYGEGVEALFELSENRILRFPTQRYFDLAQFYQSCDLAVFPKQCSLSFYDVQACGVLVVFEDNNINIARCNHGNGWTFKAGDVNDFRSKIEYVINMENSKYVEASNSACRHILQYYNYEIKAREYESILLNEYKRFGERR